MWRLYILTSRNIFFWNLRLMTFWIHFYPVLMCRFTKARCLSMVSSEHSTGVCRQLWWRVLRCSRLVVHLHFSLFLFPHSGLSSQGIDIEMKKTEEKVRDGEREQKMKQECSRHSDGGQRNEHTEWLGITQSHQHILPALTWYEVN